MRVELQASEITLSLPSIPILKEKLVQLVAQDIGDPGPGNPWRGLLKLSQGRPPIAAVNGRVPSERLGVRTPVRRTEAVSVRPGRPRLGFQLLQFLPDVGPTTLRRGERAEQKA